MALRRFYQEIKGKKLSEVPEHVKPMLSLGYIKKAIQRGMDNYHAKYIETSSPEPLFHVCYGGMIFSYLVALPTSVATSNTSSSTLSITDSFPQDPGC